MVIKICRWHTTSSIKYDVDPAGYACRTSLVNTLIEFAAQVMLRWDKLNHSKKIW
jgi:hypothetical protein